MFSYDLNTMRLPQHLIVDDHPKLPSPHLYYRQPHTVQIIQLVECDAPPPRLGSPINDSSASSSSSSSNDDSSADSLDDDDDEESACSSYCSSDLPPEETDAEPKQSYRAEASTETYSIRMKRILAWRENFSAQLSATLDEPALPLSRKRKTKCDEDDDDSVSRSSKRSRSQASQGEASVSSLGMHSCPACDAFFDTPQSLRQHGLEAQANEACCAAVEYEFE